MEMLSVQEYLGALTWAFTASLFYCPANYLWKETPLGDHPVKQHPTSAFETQVPFQSLFSEADCSFFFLLFWLHHLSCPTA